MEENMVCCYSVKKEIVDVLRYFVQNKCNSTSFIRGLTAGRKDMIHYAFSSYISAKNMDRNS